MICRDLTCSDLIKTPSDRLHGTPQERDKEVVAYLEEGCATGEELGCGITSHRKQGTIKNTLALISPDLGKRAGAYLHTYIPMGI